MIVFLVGYMGCGKTTIGRRLARRLGYDFADTDDRIEKQEGADVCDIFHYAGEEYFRKAERGMLEQLIASGDDLVVSTGGGLPVWADNMARMNGAGLTAVSYTHLDPPFRICVRSRNVGLHTLFRCGCQFHGPVLRYMVVGQSHHHIGCSFRRFAFVRKS